MAGWRKVWKRKREVVPAFPSWETFQSQLRGVTVYREDNEQ